MFRSFCEIVVLASVCVRVWCAEEKRRRREGNRAEVVAVNVLRRGAWFSCGVVRGWCGV